MSTLPEYDTAILVYICQEIVGLAVFPILNRILGPDGCRAFDKAAILKGAFERLVLFTALIHGYPQMLIAFGAMKLGTRLHDEQETTISNTYFLVGNLLSIFFAMVGSIIVNSIGAYSQSY